MSDTKPIQSALISVFHKDGLASIVKALHEQKVVFLPLNKPNHIVLATKLFGTGFAD